MKIVKLVLLLLIASISGVKAQKAFTGTFSNGYKGAKISFTVSADGKELTDLVFSGYWRCGGSTELIKAGPKKNFKIDKDGNISGIIVDPENGGSSAFRFALDGSVKGKAASGTFRMSVTGLSCDTYKLNWAAAAK